MSVPERKKVVATDVDVSDDLAKRVDAAGSGRPLP